MWPLAVAELGFRYLSINVSEMFGHPFKKPFRVAFRSVDILGLHSDWCANLTLFARVEIEWAKCAVCWTVSGRVGCAIFEDGVWYVLIGTVHKSVLMSLYPRRIVFPLYITSQ